MIVNLKGTIQPGQLRMVSGNHTLTLMGAESISHYAEPYRELPIGEKFLIEKVDHRYSFAVATILTSQGQRGRVYNSELNAYTKVI